MKGKLWDVKKKGRMNYGRWDEGVALASVNKISEQYQQIVSGVVDMRKFHSGI